MKIPKYWAKNVQVVRRPGGRPLRLACWRWSDVSTDQAQQEANDRTRDLVQKVLAGTELDRYGYGERPLREEISQAISNREGRETAVVTRNLYGALILNTAKAMFVDIDFAEKDTSEDPYLQRIQTWASRHPDVGVRIYRTFAGLRCLITNELFEPDQAETVEIMRALGSDPLYVRLCQAQACFRARLTPKPWRCGIGPPPGRYPWENAVLEARHREWERRYEQVSRSYAVCRLIAQMGQTDIHPEVEAVLSLHDQMTGTGSDRKLA